jgi:hypothetical protein
MICAQSIRALIAALAASDLTITLKKASRAIGRNDAYLQQFDGSAS